MVIIEKIKTALYIVQAYGLKLFISWRIACSAIFPTYPNSSLVLFLMSLFCYIWHATSYYWPYKSRNFFYHAFRPVCFLLHGIQECILAPIYCQFNVHTFGFYLTKQIVPDHSKHLHQYQGRPSYKGAFVVPNRPFKKLSPQH